MQSCKEFRAPHMLLPQANKPVIGIVQDTLLGCRLMTKRDSFIKKDLFMNILMWLEDWDGRVPMPAILKPEPLWTGKQVVNLIIPRVNLRRKAAWSKDHEDQDMTPYDSQVKFVTSDGSKCDQYHIIFSHSYLEVLPCLFVVCQKKNCTHYG